MGGSGVCGNRKPLHFLDRTCSRILQKGLQSPTSPYRIIPRYPCRLRASYATRGGYWNFSGRLFESDTGFEQGLEGREITVLLALDVETITTEEGGLFSLGHRAQYSLNRGSHNFTFLFQGEFLYLPAESQMEVFALSDVIIEMQPYKHNSKGRLFPFTIDNAPGLIREVGGDSEIFDNLSMSLIWGKPNSPLTSGPWGNPDTMNFELEQGTGVHDSGRHMVTIVVESNQASFLNGGPKR